MARRGDDAVVMDMLKFFTAKVQADLEKRAQDSGDAFGQARARQANRCLFASAAEAGRWEGDGVIATARSARNAPAGAERGETDAIL